MKNVSVIIPAYNAEKFIEKCLISVLAQTYRDIEVIVVNDGSTDNTKAIVEKIIEVDKRVKILSIDNCGRAKARNRGIEIAEGDWLAFLDADDYWREDKLSIQLNVAEKDGSGVVYSQRIWVDESGTPKEGFPRENLPQGMIFESLIEGNYLCTSTVLAKRALILQVGSFSEKHELKNCQDYDLWIRLSVQTAFSACDEELIFYRLHENNAHKNYQSRYAGMRACMARLREVAVNSPESREDYLKRIDLREASICESYGVHFFKSRQFLLAYEALHYANKIKKINVKRKIMFHLSGLLKFLNRF